MQLIIYISVYLVYLIFTYVTTLLFKCYIYTIQIITSIIIKIKILNINKMSLQWKLKSYQLIFEFKSPTNICNLFPCKTNLSKGNYMNK